MRDLEQQIKAWGHQVMDGAGEAVHIDEVIGRADRAGTGSRARGYGTKRRVSIGIGAAAALIAVVVAAALVRQGGSGSSSERLQTAQPSSESVQPSPPSTATGPVTFDVLSMGPALMDGMGSVRAARTQDDLSDLWADAGRPPPAPEVDFEQRMVVSITIPDDACPPELTGFERRQAEVDGEPVMELEPVFVEPDGGCVEPLIPKTYLVALDWTSTGDDFWLVLPGQPLYDFPDARVRLSRGETEPTGTMKRWPAGGPLEHPRKVVGAAIQSRLIAEVPGLLVVQAPGPDGTAGHLGFEVVLGDEIPATLTWMAVDAGRPQDARAGLEDPTTVGTDSGGTATVGRLPDSSVAVRFDCYGVRYQLAARSGPSRVLAVVDAFSAELGCEQPISSAPTECLGLADDPAGCSED